MSKKIVLIFLLMPETILYATGQTHQTINKPIESSKTFKMLSWNIYMLPYFSLFNNNGNRARNIADRLVDSDYNIIVFRKLLAVNAEIFWHSASKKIIRFNMVRPINAIYPFVPTADCG